MAARVRIIVEGGYRGDTEVTVEDLNPTISSDSVGPTLDEAVARIRRVYGLEEASG